MHSKNMLNNLWPSQVFENKSWCLSRWGTGTTSYTSIENNEQLIDLGRVMVLLAMLDIGIIQYHTISHHDVWFSLSQVTTALLPSLTEKAWKGWVWNVILWGAVSVNWKTLKLEILGMIKISKFNISFCYPNFPSGESGIFLPIFITLQDFNIWSLLLPHGRKWLYNFYYHWNKA